MEATCRTCGWTASTRDDAASSTRVSDRAPCHYLRTHHLPIGTDAAGRRRRSD